jgi:hypothetical protein
MANDRRDRQNAIAQGALDAHTLIGTVPGLMQLLSEGHVHQIQTILDAAVLNPILKKQADDLYRQSVTLQIGSQVNRDAATVAKAQRSFDKMIKVPEADHHIRLDFNKMLSADALMPRTDNSDEAEYLLKVRSTLATRGVWLRIGQPFVRRNEDSSQHLLDPKQWQLWFSLGYDGDTIPTKDATIDRDELLSTTMLGAGYYRSVHTGYIQSKLKLKMAQLEAAIEVGMEEHHRLIQRKKDAPVGVPLFSDWLLSTAHSLPGIRIWGRPKILLDKAVISNISGDVITAQTQLYIAAKTVEFNAELLAEYAEKSSNGAARAMVVFKVIETAAEIAEVVLILNGVGIGMRALRSGTRLALSEGAEGLVSNRAKKSAMSQMERRIPRYTVRPKGPSFGRPRLGNMKGVGTGFHSW